jgi:hypothetical protein
VAFADSETGKLPRAVASFGGVEYPAVMTSYRFTIDGEVFEVSDQYVDAAMVGAATITVPAEVTVRFGSGPDRVLAAWGDDAFGAPVDGTGFSVFGAPDRALPLTIRGEWGDSFVEWELYFQVAS